MELLALLLAVMFYQWILIPITKRKIGYLRDETNPIFYDYKTKWQLPFEIGTFIIFVLLAFVLTPIMGIYSAMFIPIGFILIFIVRAKLEYRYMADFKHHIISSIHAMAIFLAFAAVLIFALITT